MKLSVLWLLVAGLLAGCSTLNTHVEPKVNLKGLKHVFVQRNLNENHGMDGMIVRYLKEHGIEATSGPLTLMPPDATAYFTYQDQWDWDFKNYLIGLNVTVRNANTDRIMASATYFRPTAFTKTPYQMVELTMAALFNQKSHPSRHARPEEAPPQTRDLDAGDSDGD